MNSNSPAAPVASPQPSAVGVSETSSNVAQPAPQASSFQVSRPVRVLHVINGEHYSGAERVQDLLARNLPSNGVTVEFACLKPDRFPRDRQTQSTPLHGLAMSSRFDLRVVAKLAMLARSQNVNLLHAHTPRAAMVTALAAPLAGCPWVFHVHSPTSHDSTRPFINQVNAWVEKVALRRAAAVIGVSQTMCDHIVECGVSEQRVWRVANGVPCQNRLAFQRNIGNDYWTVGTVALFRPRKGTEILLEAIHLLREAGHDVRLRAVGGFETQAYEQFLKSQVQALELDDAVEWTGYTQAVSEEMARFDLFALPSHFGEGMPMVVLEAMALGVPVVATRVEGVPEVIEDGVSGVLAKPGDATDLARQIQRLLDSSSSREQIAEAGFNRQQKSFSDLSMADGVAEVYESLIQLGRIR